MSDGEFKKLDNAMISAYGCSRTDCWNPSSNWEGALGGYSNTRGVVSRQGEHGYYWSSTLASNTFAFMLDFDALGYDYNAGTFTNTKNYGLSVRCVMNY
jgi:uncharacterized protein (TIGR02145 family)